MARFARLVVPGYPHHITQRGVRSMDTFSGDDDRRAYRAFMAEEANRFGVTFLAWCLMSNHVHLIAQPEEEDSLARAIGEAHRRYTRMKNFAEGARPTRRSGWGPERGDRWETTALLTSWRGWRDASYVRSLPDGPAAAGNSIMSPEFSIEKIVAKELGLVKG